jgi:hypothetical protein
MYEKITRKQLEKLIREQIKVQPDLLKEGVWDSIKYGLSKLGSLEVGGKLFGREATRQKADENYQDLLDKLDEKTSEIMKQFEAHMEKEYPEFPNMKDKFEFMNAALEIESTYEVLVKAVENWRKLTDNGKKQLSPADAKKQDNIDPTTANELVEALAGYAAKLLDFKLTDVYKHFNENKKLIITEADMYALVVLEALAKYGEKTATTKGLESNLLPLVLSAAGAASSLAATYATLVVAPEYPVVSDPSLLKDQPNPEYWYREATKVAGEVGQAIEGSATSFIDATGQIAKNFGDTAGLNWYEKLEMAAKGLNKDPVTLAEELGNSMGRYGDGGVAGMMDADGIKGLSGEWARLAAEGGKERGADFASKFFTKSPPGSDVLEFIQQKASSPEMANAMVNWGGEAAAGAGKGPIGSTIMGIATGVFSLVPEPLSKVVVGALKVKGLAARGAAVTAGVSNPILAALGLGGLVSGLAVKALRAKGMKSSRAQYLKDIRDKLEKFSDEGGEPPPPPVTEKEEVIKPVFIKFDNDAIKVHTVGMRGSVHYSQTDNVRAMADYMKRLQDQKLIGKVEAELEEAPSRAARIAQAMGQEGEVSTDDFQEIFGQFQFKRYKISGSGQSGKKAANVKQLSSIINKIQRAANRSLVYNVKIEPYFAIDKSMLDEEGYQADKSGVLGALEQIIQNREILSMKEADISDDLKTLLSKYGMIGGQVRGPKVAPAPEEPAPEAPAPETPAPEEPGVEEPAASPDDAGEEDPALAALRGMTTGGAPRQSRRQRRRGVERTRGGAPMGRRGRRPVQEDVESKEANILNEIYSRWSKVAGIVEEKENE